MKISKTMLVTGAVTAVAVTSMLGASLVSAQSSNNKNALADRIASQYNLNATDVQNTVDTFRQEKKAEFQAQKKVKQEEHLQTLVDNGTITPDQKTALKQRAEEKKATFENLMSQDLTKEEMHSQMEQSHEDFETWAKDQGIDPNAIRPDKDSGSERHRGPMDSGRFNR